MHKPAPDLSHDASPGFVEFDERGNSRWIPHAEARTDETLLRMLHVGWLALVPDRAPEPPDHFGELRRSDRRGAMR